MVLIIDFTAIDFSLSADCKPFVPKSLELRVNQRVVRPILLSPTKLFKIVHITLDLIRTTLI